MTALLLVFLALLGAAVGSFLNVVIWRVPVSRSVVAPPSACPRCDSPIRVRDNVPVLSWMLLRGRCRDCATPIAVRYPLVEAATVGLFLLVGWRFGLVPELPAFLYLAAVGLALALIDLDTHRLPDVLVLPSYGVGGVLLVGASLVEGDLGSLVRAAAGGGLLFSAYFLLAVAKPGGMGFGDVKLAGLLGMYLAWLGWGPLVVGSFAAFLLGGAFAVGLLLTGRAVRTSGIPFGPWMLAGSAVGSLAGEQLWQAYLGVLM
ncbi:MULTISPECIES: prepilin peptidase [unclassified Modestobacter]|uniref:prepilin peptidase n=1 Tax=unclassified Modestobacter TaxID=2643866 RepID=UPI0022AB021A|nr:MULTISPECIES: A24 family peptidase [unclassified Modestobacter]MCZ2824685.1 prepilin peptidase [Modestobacter sp. VKM Ac-2981]MCZ2854812.1 prepilin peptidase [Modestobacter sp. VKM Ac-2982]